VLPPGKRYDDKRVFGLYAGNAIVLERALERRRVTAARGRTMMPR
jgi:hypothetical protein